MSPLWQDSGAGGIFIRFVFQGRKRYVHSYRWKLFLRRVLFFQLQQLRRVAGILPARLVVWDERVKRTLLGPSLSN